MAKTCSGRGRSALRARLISAIVAGLLLIAMAQPAFAGYLYFYSDKGAEKCVGPVEKSETGWNLGTGQTYNKRCLGIVAPAQASTAR